MHKEITSISNPFVKEVIQLSEKSRARKKQGLFIIEGLREVELALKGTFTIDTLIYNKDILTAAISQFMNNVSNTIHVSKDVYQKIAYRGTTEGIMAIVKAKDTTLETLKFTSKKPLILVAEAPEKPGNIGALLRTADAAKVDAVIITNPKTDLYNPNIIRSSVGGIFTVPVATATTEQAIAYLKKQNIAIYSAILQESVPYHTQDYKLATAIVVGTEATGLSPAWREHSTANISIPMGGAIDSMNVSVAAGILIFEAKRQRGFV